MLIEGTHTLQAQPGEVWQALTQPDILTQTLPGIEQIEPLANDTYNVTLHIHQGPFKGKHTVRLTFAQQSYPEQYHLTITNVDSNDFEVNGTVHLRERAQTTIVTYHGNLTINHVSTQRLQKLVKGALKLLLQQYFQELTETLYKQDLAHSTQRSTDPIVLQQARGNVAILPQSRMEKQAQDKASRGIVNKIFDRLTSLIWPEQTLKELWLKRIRRYGTMGGLLFLIWVGTRIPRR